jgi:hypothetical protein
VGAHNVKDEAHSCEALGHAKSSNTSGKSARNVHDLRLNMEHLTPPCAFLHDAIMSWSQTWKNHLVRYQLG